MSTTITNEAKRIAKELYLKGIVSNLEKRDAAESVVEQGLKLYAGLVQVDEEKKAKSLENEIEQLRVQLAGCGVAAMQNTAETVKDRAVHGDYGYSASYSDVCKAVDREIRYRMALEKIASGTEDIVPPYRYASAEVLKRWANKALIESV